MPYLKCKSIGYLHLTLQFSRSLIKAKIVWITLILFLPVDLRSEAARLFLQRQYPVIEAENQVWIGMPTGLYRYNSEDNSFKRYDFPTAGQDKNVKQLYFHDEWLWCVLENGLAALHIRLNEWLYFDIDNGLPSNEINGMDFETDYVWIATSNGAARYDLLIEEWETYGKERGVPDSCVNDILLRNEQVWLISKHKYSEYDPQFEKWRHYHVDEDTTIILKRMFLFGEEIWIVSNEGLIRFHPDLQTQQSFFQAYMMPDNLIEIFIENDRLWAITRMGLYYYENDSRVWREFSGNSNLISIRVQGAYIDQQEIWILTDSNVMVWNRKDKYWELIDYASGLSTSIFQSVYVNGEMVILLNPQSIDYRMNKSSPWLTHPIEISKTAKERSLRNIFSNLFDNEAGGEIPLGKYNWSWEGSRIIFINKYVNKYQSLVGTSDASYTSGQILDIKSQLTLGKSRNVNGFYNNIDYSETMYGVRYSDRDKGLIRELNWGDFRREPGSIPFGEETSVFGSSLWMQAGQKTERFKRSLVTLKAQTGEKRSQKTYEFYEGAVDCFKVEFLDVNYIKNQYFYIPGLGADDHFEAISIYVDDLNHANNTDNTLEFDTIAGITGDFDLLKDTEDYYWYEKGKTIRFLKYVNPSWTIVARYSSNGITYERILQHGSTVTTACNNYYYLGGTGIIPFSFRLIMTDTSGSEVPIENYGIDANGDGWVDQDWIDYERGLLFFPDREPFPPEVYDSMNPASYYHFEADFVTELFLIQLEHNNLVRGSEELRLDGNVAIGGNDYVLDYTSGTIVFVREGVVNPDTRIEIEYEYYIEEEENMHSVMFNMSPSDNLYVQGDWLRYSKEEGDTVGNEGDMDYYALHSEVRQKIGGYDFRLVPGIAYNPTENKLSAADIGGFISSSRYRFQSRYQEYSEHYNNIYRPQSILGNTKSQLVLFTSVDVSNALRLSGEWKNVHGFAQEGYSEPTDQSGNLKFIFSKRKWPGWQISYHRVETKNNENRSNKYYIQNRLEYQLPEHLSQKCHITGLKMEALLRNGEQSGISKIGSDEQKFRQGYIRMNTIISDQFQSSIFYRRNDMWDTSVDKRNKPMSRSERLLIDLSHEKWRLMQVNLRVENNVSRDYHRSASSKNVNLNQFSQVNMRVSPGQIWQLLNPLHFELNYNESIYGWGITDERIGSWVWQLTKDHRTLEDAQRNWNYYIKNEIRPNSKCLILSLIEWNKRISKLSSSLLEDKFWRWSEKLDLKIGYKTRLNVQYRQYHNDWEYERTDKYYEPSTWVEHRWTPDFLNIVSLLYRNRQKKEANLEDVSHNWETRCDFIWRKYKFIKIRRLEIRQSFSCIHRSTEGNNPESNYLITSSSSIDLYPIHSMIFRMQLALNRYIDDYFPENDYTSVMLYLKTSFRF